MHASKYFVDINGIVSECVARGVLKIKSDGIVVGDYVEVQDNAITSVYPRKNYFIRPNVANVDVVNIIIANPPKPDFYMLDKLLIACEMAKNVQIVITVNKEDLSDETFNRVVENYSKVTSKIISVSAKTGFNMQKLAEQISGKLTVFAGQSAVGKSTIINSLLNTDLKTNDVSGKTQRGRHTTTVSEIYENGEIRIMDTPGFSVITNGIDEDKIKDYYYDFSLYEKQCYFVNCLHINEPDCMIKKLVQNGQINKERYDRYLQIYADVKNSKLRKKDTRKKQK